MYGVIYIENLILCENHFYITFTQTKKQCTLIVIMMIVIIRMCASLFHPKNWRKEPSKTLVHALHVIKDKLKVYFQKKQEQKRKKIHEKSGALQGVHASSKLSMEYITYMFGFMGNI